MKKGPALLKEATAVRGSPVLSQLTTPGRPGNGRREQKEGDRQPTLTLPPGEKRRAEFERYKGPGDKELCLMILVYLKTRSES